MTVDELLTRLQEPGVPGDALVLAEVMAPGTPEGVELVDVDRMTVAADPNRVVFQLVV